MSREGNPPTMLVVVYWLAALVPVVGAPTGVLRAQEGPAIARTEAEQAACRRWPLIFRTHGSRGDSYLHKDPVSGASCLIPTPPPRPTAVTVDGKVYCPGPDSTAWSAGPPSWAPEVVQIEHLDVVRDSTVLLALGCKVRPAGLIRVFLKPARPALPAESRGGLTVSLAAGPRHGFGGDHYGRGGIAGNVSLAASVWTASSIALTAGLDASVSTSVGTGEDACVSCPHRFPSVSGVAATLGWLVGRPHASALFSGALGVGRVSAGGVDGVGVHLQAGLTLPFSVRWALSLEGRATRTPRRTNEHLIVGALLLGIRWRPTGF